jgi:hypothetical protein
MNRLLQHLVLISAATVLASSVASAQWYASSHWHDRPQRQQSFHSGHSNDFTHSYRRPVVREINIQLLDSYADRLQSVAEHLHDDAHALSQGYYHSAAIEGYVSQIEHLQTHIHDVLHQAAANRLSNAVCLSHIRSDVRQVATLVSRLQRELSHQASDGVCRKDARLISHMRYVITSEMNPLLALMNAELTGHSSYSVPVQTHSVYRQPGISFRFGF